MKIKTNHYLSAFLRPYNIPCCQNWVGSPSYNLQVWNTQEIIWSRLSVDPGASQKNKTISVFETTCSAWNGFQTVYSVAIFVIIPRCRKDFHFRHLYLRFVYKINFQLEVKTIWEIINQNGVCQNCWVAYCFTLPV